MFCHECICFVMNVFRIQNYSKFLVFCILGIKQKLPGEFNFVVIEMVLFWAGQGQMFSSELWVCISF